MPTVCFAPGCKSGYTSERIKNKASGSKNPSFFSVPKEDHLLELWRKAIPRKDLVLTSIHKVCELHFEEECIERMYRIPLSDGTIHVYPRTLPILKPDAIPTIFPNIPKYLSSSTKKRKPPTPRPLPSDKKTKFVVKDVTSFPASENPDFGFVVEDVTSLPASENSDFNYGDLMSCLSEVHLPDPMWTISKTAHFIMCVKWDANYSYERRVVICEDLCCKIFLKDVQISAQTFIDGASCLTEVLRNVENLPICKNADLKSSAECLGCLQPGTKQSVCLGCKKRQKKRYCLEQKARLRLLAKKRLQVAHRNMKKRNSRLERKVLQLKKEVFEFTSW